MTFRHDIMKSAICGCFYCLEMFPYTSINEWVDPHPGTGLGDTALCPYCGIDAVVGFPEDVPGNRAYLERRQRKGFGE